MFWLMTIFDRTELGFEISNFDEHTGKATIGLNNSIGSWVCGDESAVKEGLDQHRYLLHGRSL